jgi:hypothetical protein
MSVLGGGRGRNRPFIKEFADGYPDGLANLAERRRERSLIEDLIET